MEYGFIRKRLYKKQPERMIILTIYVVKPGDSLYAIANKYGVTVDALIYDNQITDPLKLVEGQSLFISATSVEYRVRPGDSLFKIARYYDTSVESILSANPTLTARTRLYPGQLIVIPLQSEMLGTAQINGFTVKTTMQTINETLPYLTYISAFSWQVDEAGGITPLNDDAVNAAAREQNVAPLMSIANIKTGSGFSSDVAHAILTDAAAQNAFLTNVMAAMRQKNYYGVIFDIEYIYPFDRDSYTQFLRRAVQMLHEQGYIVMTAVAPKLSATQTGTLYEAHDYKAHGEIVDYVIIMTYEWGYIYGPAMAVAPIDQVKKVLDYAVSVIPSEKILMGMPNYGYDWTLPFVRGSAADPVSNTEAVKLASEVGAAIQYDEKAQAPFFNYYRDRKKHEVWFDDARSIEARLKLIHEYKLGGLSYWTIDDLFRTQFLVLESLYSVSKVL